MKKYYYSLALIAFAVAIIVPTATKAEEVNASLNVEASVTATVSPSPSPTPANIREKLRAELELKNQNLKLNQAYRNDMLERQRKMASSTASTTDKNIRKDLKDFKGDVKDLKEDFRDNVKDIKKDAKDEAKDFMKDHKDDFRNGSSTLGKKEIRREIELNLFKIHKDMLVRQLNLAVDNLKQIRERITSRITKAEQAGKNMTEPKALLVTADTKLTAAETAITALMNLNVGTSAPASTTATTTVKLDKPREIGDKAIKAVREARDALQKVIVSVAHNMGNKDVHITATSTASTTTQ